MLKKLVLLVVVIVSLFAANSTIFAAPGIGVCPKPPKPYAKSQQVVFEGSMITGANMQVGQFDASVPDRGPSASFSIPGVGGWTQQLAQGVQIFAGSTTITILDFCVEATGRYMDFQGWILLKADSGRK